MLDSSSVIYNNQFFFIFILQPVETFTPNFGQNSSFPPSVGQPVNVGGFGSAQPSPWSPGPDQSGKMDSVN